MNKLFKDVTNKKICGVCSGVANWLNVDITLVRVLWAVLTLCCAGFPGIILYAVMAFVMPENNINQ